MGLPSVNIIFKQKAASAIQQGAVGMVALILKDASVTIVTEYIVEDIADIPNTLSAANQDYAKWALIGGPKTVKLVVIGDSAANYNDALDYLETIKWNILAVPGISAGDVAGISTWAKGLFDNKERKIMTVLPNNSADHPAVVNFATEDIQVGTNTYSASEYSARIAGLIAGMSLTVSPTFQVLNEVTNVPKLTKVQADAAVDSGKLILYHDGEKVKIARGVTSRTTIDDTFGADWKKIKVVRILNKTYEDIKGTIEDMYIGKVQNSYINKLLLISAINAYFEQLEQDGILDPGKNASEIDVAAQKTYLKSLGVDVSKMTDQQVKEANTRDQVYLQSTQRPLDAIEDVKLTIYH